MIYTNIRNLGYQYQLEIIPLNTTFKKVKDLISKLNPKKVFEVNLITGKLLQLPDKTSKYLTILYNTM